MLSKFNTKGGNWGTWREPKRNIGMMLASKAMRRCGYCGKYAYHDARNCPERRKKAKDMMCTRFHTMMLGTGLKGAQKEKDNLLN